MRLSDFDYSLPKELIAQYPLKRRDLARLLVLDRKKKSIKHCIFKEIINYLNKDDLLILNDTKVLPCRLKGRRLTGGKVEILLLAQKNEANFLALIKPARLKVGEEIIFDNDGISAKIINRNEVVFSSEDIDKIYQLGKIPLPPYIKREPQDLDNIYYQTVYARYEGAVASPTAGLHFTKRLLKKIELSGINIGYITLHISYATFRPVKVDDITQHKMDKEYFYIPNETIELLKKTKLKAGRIITVGTTSLRALETYASSGQKSGYTDLFIYPGYKFKMTDCLLTNFHLPRTSLFILVCAFAGEELIKKAYQEAIKKRYRFYSYGDAMLIL